ncbi:MAG: hypothetical protein ACYTGC_05730 [Planctomycetota bacterium]
MAIAHICYRCGTDLARVRAHREPHYGLLLLQCPGCCRFLARRRHPLHEFWRGLRRVDWALTIVVFNVLALICLLILTAGNAAWFGREILEDGAAGLLSDHRVPLFGCFVLTPILVGAWLAIGLPHWRRTTAWAMFTVAASLMTLLVVVMGVIDDLIDNLDTGASLRQIALSGGHTMAWALVAVVLTVALAPIGVLPGRGLAWLTRKWRQSVRSLRRRRLRRERTG